jgi:predicted RecB family nuclease
MSLRHDVSTVPLQGGYVAKQCPVRAQNDLLLPDTPAETAAFQQRLFDKGNAFEADVLAGLLAVQPEAVVVQGKGTEAEAATLLAMQGGAPLILNARLRDEAGRRVGKPDLLVRGQGGGFYPVDIKWHMALDVAKPDARGPGVPVSPLSQPTLEAAVEDACVTPRPHEEDLLQLAHYRRMLEAAGMAAADARWAGIIGTERQVVWHDLDAPMWRTASTTKPTKLRTTMERYDFEFGFRLDIIAVAQQHVADPAVDLLVAPVRCAECPTCPWNQYCRSILEEPPGDVSLLPRVGWRQWKAHRDRGVTTQADLASLDTRTAQLVAAKLDVTELLDKVEAFDPAVPLSSLQGTSLKPSELRRLTDVGLVTCGDLLTLDRATAQYSGAGMGTLPDQIDLARAALGPDGVYRKRGVDEIVVPRADIEVDVDMENSELGVYLWGNLVTRYDSTRTSSQYLPFVTWEPMAPEVETANSLAFWRWLMQLRDEAHADRLTFAAYCWNAPAENQQMRRLGRAAGITREVEAFIASDDWVDLLKVWDTQVITGRPSGLKVVAPLAGVRWRVDEPGGGESMVRYDVAVGSGDRRERDAARRWLCDYNEDDVHATRAIRRWLSEQSGTILSIESQDRAVTEKAASLKDGRGGIRRAAWLRVMADASGRPQEPGERATALAAEQLEL